jgi:tRNA-dihydrouridine synthase A
MAEPGRVAEAVAAMTAAVAVPVTVKCRIGIDGNEEFEFLAAFVATVRAAGCRTFVVHARKAWLSGLSPKENREIPPLRYETVHRLKREFPELRIVLNGGLRSPATALDQLAHVDGVMIGREAYENPWSLTAFHQLVLGREPPLPSPFEVVEAMADYALSESRHGVPVPAVARHMLGLFNGMPGARAWRRSLAALEPTAPANALLDAARLVDRPRMLAARPSPESLTFP